MHFIKSGLFFSFLFVATQVCGQLNYACDPASEAVSAPHTSAYVTAFEPISAEADTTYERWALEVDGNREELNVAIARPAPSVHVRGVVIIGHGHSPTLATLPPSAMVDPYFNAQMTSRGYLSVTVARRGNFGSTGARLIDVQANGMLNKYWNHQLAYADIELAAWKYQSASLVAALQKMSTDSAYQPYLSSIALIGASGGANTVVQTAVDSSVFQAAANKALIRLTGSDSAYDTNPDALPGVNEYSTRIAKNAVSSLWIGGQEDKTTSIGQLACQYKFFNQASGFQNWFYVVPNVGHEVNIFSSTLAPIFKQYMEARNFAGFFTPQSGWWWNANEPGRGYFIEARNGRHFTASYLYDNSGNAIWYVSGPDNVSGSTLPGFLGAYSGGQTLTGTYKAPAGPSPVGSMSISFSDSTHGTITWPGGTVPITRYELGTGSLALPDPSFKPETGWWWNASEGGRGFSIEVQGDNLFIAGFMYDGGGNPVWYVSAGKMTTPTLYQGTWAQYQNGQAMGGPAKTASVKNANVGGVSISFSSTTTATLLLPDGRTLPLTRYPF